MSRGGYRVRIEAADPT
eukprot:gene127-biopygen8886